MSEAKWTQRMHKSWHLPQRLRSSPVSSDTDLEDIGSEYGGSKEETIPGMNSLKKWRTINKGPIMMKYGVTHNRCKHHVYEGRYDGLYYHNHTESTHEQKEIYLKQGYRPAQYLWNTTLDMYLWRL